MLILHDQHNTNIILLIIHCNLTGLEGLLSPWAAGFAGIEVYPGYRWIRPALALLTSQNKFAILFWLVVDLPL